ncbi:craniofacial development protein 2-like [Cydia pomonella]|uniref:craniofacial development protein 2-like n=1 Tax=Cydia pomonella TaxID=82600 RepID=UPI002ADE6574|nr:craniofacial development protein 2-like [Cydia pomonella]
MDFRLASWNVRSLYRPGAVYQVKNELQRYNIGVAALQEVRWLGTGECSVDNEVVLFYCGPDNGQHRKGVGFMVSKKVMGNVIRFDAISDRLCVLRVKSKLFNISILNAYAPTELAEDIAKDEFYEQLEMVYEQIPSFDVKIVLGDFNAKVGREDIFIPTIGRHSKHDISNDNGLRLISFAASKAMVIKSTMYPHKDIFKGTWKSPDGVTINQIDHVLIDDRHKSSIQNVRAFRGADCDSDHYLLGVKVKAKIKVNGKFKRHSKPQINTDSLKDKVIAEKFEFELRSRFQGLPLADNVDEHWESIRDNVKEVAFKVKAEEKEEKEEVVE